MPSSAPDWTPVVDLVEKLNALAMEWDKAAERRACAGDLRAVLSGQYDPRDVQQRDAADLRSQLEETTPVPGGGSCWIDILADPQLAVDLSLATHKIALITDTHTSYIIEPVGDSVSVGEVEAAPAAAPDKTTPPVARPVPNTSLVLFQVTPIEVPEAVQRAYAEAWFRTIGMDEEGVQQMVAAELAAPAPWRIAALQAALATAERDYRARYDRLLAANRKLVGRLQQLEAVDDELGRALGQLEDARRELARRPASA